jgi:hypothetical protein
MGIKYISGFRGLDNAKQHLRRSTHLGSATTSSSTVLNPSEAFDQQACFVYLNGAMLREGASGAGGDYVLSGTNTITFNTAVASTDIIEVVSYAFQNPTLPQTMQEIDHAVIAAETTLHATSRVTDGDYDTSADTLVKASHGLVVGDVISVISATGTDTIAAGRYKVLTVTDSGNVVLTDIDGNALSFGGDSDADVTYDVVFSLTVPNLTVVNHAMVYLNGLLLVEDTDYYRDQQRITLDKTVNIATGHQIAIRHFGSYVTAADGEVQRTGITITDDTHNLLLSSSDLVNSTTAAFQLQVSVRHATAATDSYRIANLFVRAEKNVPADCYLHLISDAGNIANSLEVLDVDDYSAASDMTDGNVGIGITADANGWYVYLANRAGHSIVAGFKATAISN